MTPRVRFAPSPTGFLHVGGARTALVNWLYARKHGGTFILRIEDTDQARSSEDMVKGILDGMRWLGMDWDEGPFLQSERMAFYKERLAGLLASGKAYRCFCTKETLEDKRKAAAAAKKPFLYDRVCLAIAPEEAARRAAAREAHVVRIRVPEGDTVFDDAVKGVVKFRNAELEDTILLRADGWPTYPFVVVCDDIAMAITHVIRGDDHLANTPKQIVLYNAFGATVPQFGHLPLILGMDKKKLSKRHGPTSVMSYAEAGILPEAMRTFLAGLGYNLEDEQKVYAADELVAAFDLKGVKKSPSVFDTARLEWLNARAVGASSAQRLMELLPPAFYERTGLKAGDGRLAEVVDVMKSRARDAAQLASTLLPFFVEDFPYEEEAARKQFKGAETADHLSALEQGYAALADWDAAALEAALRQCAEGRGLSAGKLIHPLRLALTGFGVSPSMFDVAAVMGRDAALARIRRAIGHNRSLAPA